MGEVDELVQGTTAEAIRLAARRWAAYHRGQLFAQTDGLTLSPRQLRWAIEDAGLSPSAEGDGPSLALCAAVEVLRQSGMFRYKRSTDLHDEDTRIVFF